MVAVLRCTIWGGFDAAPAFACTFSTSEGSASGSWRRVVAPRQFEVMDGTPCGLVAFAAGAGAHEPFLPLGGSEARSKRVRADVVTSSFGTLEGSVLRPMGWAMSSQSEAAPRTSTFRSTVHSIQ